LRALGLLQNGDVIEVKRVDLVAGYEGQTAGRTARKVQEAIGGVLFIDEAYSLASRHKGDFGREAIDTLTAEMENRRGQLVVIAAGYPESMEEFLQDNDGLRSRFPLRVDFPDYSVPELVEILRRRCDAEGYTLAAATADRAAAYLAASRAAQPLQFGNARAVRDLFDAMESRLAGRASAAEDVPVNVLEPQDVPDVGR
jgi:SpoVK/Ycf46/Vps4 family AAA+-type ATPase